MRKVEEAGLTDLKDKTLELPVSGFDASARVKELEAELSRWKSVFDSSRLLVGHELIRPVTAIEGYLDLLESELKGQLNEKSRGYIEKVRASAKRLKDIADSFIQMLMLDREDELRIGKDKVNVVELVRMVADRYVRSGTPIEIKCTGSIDPIVVPRKYLEVVLENVISNAIDHGKSKEPIEVSIYTQEDRRGENGRQILMIEITDRGSGIPEKNVLSVFAPFYKLDESGGHGLGLTLVKNLLYVMGGNISIKSREGEGTTATIVLPYCSPKSQEMVK